MSGVFAQAITRLREVWISIWVLQWEICIQAHSICWKKWVADGYWTEVPIPFLAVSSSLLTLLPQLLLHCLSSNGLPPTTLTFQIGHFLSLNSRSRFTELMSQGQTYLMWSPSLKVSWYGNIFTSWKASCCIRYTVIAPDSAYAGGGGYSERVGV